MSIVIVAERTRGRSSGWAVAVAVMARSSGRSIVAAMRGDGLPVQWALEKRGVMMGYKVADIPFM